MTFVHDLLMVIILLPALASQSMRTDEGVASPSIRSETTTNSVNMNNSVAGMMSAIPDQEVDVYGFVKPGVWISLSS